MPMYEFKCKCASCKHIFEVYQVPEKEKDFFQPCPECGGDAYRIPINKGQHIITIGEGFDYQGMR